MGSWGTGLYDNDKAADMVGELFDYLYKKYFNEGCKPKANLDAEELLALGGLFATLGNIGGIVRPEQDYVEELIEAIKSKATAEYFSDWKEPSNRKRVVRNLINRLVRTL